MSTAEQRRRYKGVPPRPWIRVRLAAKDGATQDFDLLADTGNPFAIIISQTAMAKLGLRVAPDVDTNFGALRGGWLRVQMPDLGVDEEVIGYASDAVVASATTSSPDFAGLAGLPLLRLFEYGGDADWFWVRKVERTQ